MRISRKVVKIAFYKEAEINQKTVSVECQVKSHEQRENAEARQEVDNGGQS